MNTGDDATQRMNASGEIYAQFPIKLRDRLHEFSGAQLKVWLAYLTHANKEFDGLAWPGLDLLRKETGLSDDYISKVRWELVKNGWLVSKGIIRKNGKFSGAPAFLPVIPERSDAGNSPVPEKVRNRKKYGTGKSTRTDTGKFTATGTGKSPVRSSSNEVELREVEPTNPPTPLAGWMVDLFLQFTLTAPFRNEDDDYAIELLASKHGEAEVKRVWLAFFHRSGGLKDVKRPFRLFVSEFSILQRLASDLERCHLI